MHTSHNGGIQTQLFQFQARVEASTQLLNCVLRRVVHHTKNTHMDIILMRSDVALRATQLVEYYGLRFQIEFNFRDAKQHVGIADFMHITPTLVHNATNLAIGLVNVSATLIADSDGAIDGVRDLKTALRGRKFVAVV